MENSKRRIFIDVLLVFTCLLVLATIAYHFYSQNKKGKAYKAQEYALKEQVVWDLYYHYENLKDFASSWKSYYAKLSLNSNRDTIAHPKYTVKELTRLHRGIISGIANYENNAVITHHKIDISQISNLYPVGYYSRQLLSTYQFREKLYEQAKELNSIYVSLVNNTRVTDSVDTSYNTESKFYAYFSSLRRLDEVIYELLS